MPRTPKADQPDLIGNSSYTVVVRILKEGVAIHEFKDLRVAEATLNALRLIEKAGPPSA